MSDAQTGAELFRFDPGGEVFAFALTPEVPSAKPEGFGTRLVVSHTDTTLSVRDWPALLSNNLRRGRGCAIDA